MKVLPLQGFKAYRAFNAFHVLMLGLKMLPSYMGESYEEFYARLDKLDLEEQKKFIKEAVLFVELGEDEVAAFISFACDKNGVPYSKTNLKNLGPDEIYNIIVNVCVEIIKIKIDFVTPQEKKN